MDIEKDDAALAKEIASMPSITQIAPSIEVNNNNLGSSKQKEGTSELLSDNTPPNFHDDAVRESPISYLMALIYKEGGSEEFIRALTHMPNATFARLICAYVVKVVSERNAWNFKDNIFQHAIKLSKLEIKDVLERCPLDVKVVTPFNVLPELSSAPYITFPREVDYSVQDDLQLGGLLRKSVRLSPLRASYEDIRAYVEQLSKARNLGLIFDDYDDILVSLSAAIVSRYSVKVVGNVAFLTERIGAWMSPVKVWNTAVAEAVARIDKKEARGMVPKTAENQEAPNALSIVYALLAFHVNSKDYGRGYADMKSHVTSLISKMGLDPATPRDKTGNTPAAAIEFYKLVHAEKFQTIEFENMKKMFREEALFWSDKGFLRDFVDFNFIGKEFAYFGSAQWGPIQMLYSLGVATTGIWPDDANPITGIKLEGRLLAEGVGLKARLPLLQSVVGLKGMQLVVSESQTIHLPAYTVGKRTAPQLAHETISKFQSDKLGFKLGEYVIEVWESLEKAPKEVIIKGNDEEGLNAVLNVAQAFTKAAYFGVTNCICMIHHNYFRPHKLPFVITKFDEWKLNYKIIKHPLPTNDSFYWALYPKDYLYKDENGVTKFKELTPDPIAPAQFLWAYKEVQAFCQFRKEVAPLGWRGPLTPTFFNKGMFQVSMLFTIRDQLRNKTIKQGLGATPEDMTLASQVILAPTALDRYLDDLDPVSMDTSTKESPSTAPPSTKRRKDDEEDY